MHLLVAEGEHLDATTEMLPPTGNYRTIFRRGLPGSKVVTEQLIFIQPYFYYLPSGATKWQVQVVNDDRRALTSARKYVFMFFPWLMSAKLKLVESDQVDGTEALRYEISEYGATTMAVKENPKVWVRASDGLPLKLLLSDKDGRPRYTITFSDYNQPLAINAPSM